MANSLFLHSWSRSRLATLLSHCNPGQHSRYASRVFRKSAFAIAVPDTGSLSDTRRGTPIGCV